MKIRITKIIEDKFDLNKELKKRNISQRQLAKLTGIFFTTINKVANGLVATEEIANKIKKALK